MNTAELPWSKSSEQAVLGAVFIAPRTVEILGDLKPDCFYLPGHRAIWEAMLAVVKRGRAIDTVTVADELKARGELLRLEGGELYLVVLANAVPTAENVQHYAAIVREKAILRRALALLAEVSARAHGESAQAEEVIGQLREGVALLEQAGEGDPRRVGDAVRGTLDTIEIKGKRLGEYAVPTGLLAFDRTIGGMPNGKLVVVGGLPSMGKTAMACGIAAHAALTGIPTLVVSLETDMQDLVERFLGWKGGISPHDMNMGKLRLQDWTRLYEAADKFADAPLWVDDRPWHTIQRLVATIRRWYARHARGKRAFVMVDYLQLIESQGEERRDIEVGKMSGGLKAIAKELDIPVLVISSLNSDAFKHEGPPELGHFRDSKKVEFDADLVIFPYREIKNQADRNNPGPAEWIVAKYKGGPVGSVGCYWNAPYMRFEDMPENVQTAQEELPL